MRRNLLVSNKAVEIRESVESDLNSINLHLSVKVELISILSFTSMNENWKLRSVGQLEVETEVRKYCSKMIDRDLERELK